ncbi:hypothetical protein ACP70R_036610 [Stipagrostis hirtigluma subsp. patula]
MGNCAVTQQAVTSWADDGEWDLSSTDEEAAGTTSGRREEHAAEVTIRISRRQLQELMDKRAARELKSRRSAAALLADIINAGEVYHHLQRCRAAHWRPALQSIPEAVES